ncbi:hypothetical protein J7E88_11415 [Streptomyces sp. ISL-10]|uniref:hypothetical protein n=1 Tax=Streptomyces sp. ISL-10 TaxID=2819172 RepID=UPI001BE8D81B|nr:hypothetical protein [Streptomyces sp. ISL-10]MBT2365897.1 hypothetical protein [Streptomyces sp. ISL-10]
MTGHAFPHTAAPQPVFDPYRFPGAVIDDHSQTTHTPHGTPEPGDFFLPAPDACRRVPMPLEPEDRRRLDLHAALTMAGIAPLPGDLDAIDALCTLDDSIHTALRRWIARTV